MFTRNNASSAYMEHLYKVARERGRERKGRERKEERGGGRMEKE